MVMPKLSKVTKANRIASVLQVITMIQQGADRTLALETAGITKEQFNLCVSKNPDIVDVFYDVIQQAEKRELTAILLARETIIQNLLTKISQASASNLDVIAGLTYLDKRQADLESKQGVANAAELNAHEYLQGPKTEKKASRLTATVTMEGTGKVTISTEEAQIIDATFSEDITPHQALLEADLEADRSQSS